MNRYEATWARSRVGIPRGDVVLLVEPAQRVALGRWAIEAAAEPMPPLAWGATPQAVRRGEQKRGRLAVLERRTCVRDPPERE
jgi:hypothetical protein